MEAPTGLDVGALDRDLPGFGPFGTAGQHCFDPTHPAYRRIATLAEIRRRLPVLRHGRQYLRQVARSFENGFARPRAGDLLAWSRILDDEEALIVVNVNGGESLGGAVVVDAGLNGMANAEFFVIANTLELGENTALAVGARLQAGRTTDGTAYVSMANLPPGEVVVLVNRA